MTTEHGRSYSHRSSHRTGTGLLMHGKHERDMSPVYCHPNRTGVAFTRRYPVGAASRAQGGAALTELIKPGPEFRQLFRTFEHTAFRLETFDQYDASYENESLRKFLAGEPDDLLWMRSWLAMLGEATAEGRRFSRVRVVTMPLNDYSRFGVWCSQFTGGAGEDIRYLPRDQAGELPKHDYWLFDSRKLVRMHFDGQMSFLGGEVVEDPVEIVQHNYWRDAAWHHAVRRDDFAKK